MLAHISCFEIISSIICDGDGVDSPGIRQMSRAYIRAVHPTSGESLALLWMMTDPSFEVRLLDFSWGSRPLLSMTRGWGLLNPDAASGHFMQNQAKP